MSTQLRVLLDKYFKPKKRKEEEARLAKAWEKASRQAMLLEETLLELIGKSVFKVTEIPVDEQEEIRRLINENRLTE